MNHTLEIILFFVLFSLSIYLFFTIIGLYAAVQNMISESELKMDSKINAVKFELYQLYKKGGYGDNNSST